MVHVRNIEVCPVGGSGTQRSVLFYRCAFFVGRFHDKNVYMYVYDAGDPDLHERLRQWHVAIGKPIFVVPAKVEGHIYELTGGG